MLRSLYSAISGLRNFQTFMDVVGNNIANVDTIGFKGSRVTFEDVLSQNARLATPAAADGSRGGTNPMQIGLGMYLATVDVLQAQGSMQYTNKTTDCAIQGNGYFVMSDGTSTWYTRAGNFDVATDGTLISISSGLKVQGWQADATGAITTTGPTTDIVLPLVGPPALSSFTIGTDGKIVGTFADGTTRALGQMALATFANPSGLVKVGGSLYQESTNSGVAAIDTPTVGGRGTVSSGFLEMSNVDLAAEFTNMIVAQRGFQANSRVITTSDEILQDMLSMKR